MAARLIDESEDQLSPTYGAEDDPLKALEGEAAPSGNPGKQVPQGYILPDDAIPEEYRYKYSGKNAEDLLDILLNQEKVIGRQGQQMGDQSARINALEELVNKALTVGGSSPGQARETEEELTDEDFSLSPKEATSKLIDRRVNEQLGTTQQQLNQITQAQRLQSFAASHPTAEADVNDPAFNDFIQKSAYRRGLASRAFGDMANIDFDAAEELWMAWEESRPQGQPEERPTGDDAGTQSDVPPDLVSSGAQGGAGPAGSGDKRIYSESALIALQQKDPDTYYRADVYAKISKAYAEGRVKFDMG